jgi:hypothetical protein
MTERSVTIGINISGAAAAQSALGNILQQRNELLQKSRINLNVDTRNLEAAQRAAAQARASATDASKDFLLLGGAISNRAIPQTAAYSAALGSVIIAAQRIGPSLASSLQRANSEFGRQKDLLRFWGTSGYLSIGLDHFKGALSAFVSGGGYNFTKWLQNTVGMLTGYRTALVAASAAAMGVASAAALSSKSELLYIKEILGTNLMHRKLGDDTSGAMSWIQSAEEEDWTNRKTRVSAYQSILSKNPSMGAHEGQGYVEGLEKYFFSKQELFKEKGIGSVEQMASILSAQTMSGEHEEIFKDLIGLGFSTWSPRARFASIADKASDLNMQGEVQARPEVALANRLQDTVKGVGDVAVGPLLAVLNTLLKISEVAGKIPHLPQIVGWAIVLTGMAAAGLTVLSMLAGLAPVLGTVIGLVKGAHLATLALTAAQWLLNVALTANPIGVAVVAIVALIGVLYLLEKKFGIVTKGWNALKAGMSSMGNAFKDAGGMGVLKIAVDALVANNPMLKILLFQFDLLKKIWLGGETLNKIMGGAMTIWQQMGMFFSWMQNGLSSILATLTALKDSVVDRLEGIFGKEGKTGSELTTAVREEIKKDPMFSGLSEAQQDYLARTASGEKYWKNDETGEYKYSTASPGEGWRDFTGEGSTEIGRGEAIGISSHMKAKANEIAEDLRNPSGLSMPSLPSLPELPAAKDVYDKAKDIAEDEAKRIQEDVQNKDVVSTLIDVLSMKNRVLGKAGQSIINWATGKDAPSMDVGGSITGSGSIIGHSGEQIDNASVVADGDTTLARINKAFTASGQGGQSITIGSTTININVDKMNSDIDLQKAISQAGDEFDRQLMFRLRNLLDSGSLRGIGYMRG